MNDEKTIRLNGWHIEFGERDYNGGVCAIIRGESPGGKRLKIRVKFNFSCWSFIVRKFSDMWVIEKERQLREINRIDKSLPQE